MLLFVVVAENQEDSGKKRRNFRFSTFYHKNWILKKILSSYWIFRKSKVLCFYNKIQNLKPKFNQWKLKIKY